MTLDRTGDTLERWLFYDVDREGEKVAVVAIGRKWHNRLRIAGEEIELRKWCLWKRPL
jgi:hypothetical protein